MKENEEQTYNIKFYFKDKSSYELNYNYDSKAQVIKYKNVKVGLEKKLEEHLNKKVIDLKSALIRAMQQNKVKNLTAENIKASEDQIKNNLINLDLGEGFLIDIIPDIFGLQNSCKNNLQVVCHGSSYVELNNKRVQVSGKYQEADCQKKSEQIVNQVEKIHKQNGNKKITFVEKMIFAANWDDDEHPKNEISPSWIFTYIYKKGYGNYGIYYEDLKSIEYFGHDSQKSENNEKISRAGKIARIIFLIILIAFAIFLPTYLWIVGLLFSNVAIPIIVFSAEAILITLITILILSIRDIDNENNLLQKQIGLSNDLETENSIDKNKNRQENQNNSKPNQLENNGQNLDEHGKNGE